MSNKKKLLAILNGKLTLAQMVKYPNLSLAESEDMDYLGTMLPEQMSDEQIRRHLHLVTKSTGPALLPNLTKEESEELYTNHLNAEKDPFDIERGLFLMYKSDFGEQAIAAPLSVEEFVEMEEQRHKKGEQEQSRYSLLFARWLNHPVKTWESKDEFKAKSDYDCKRASTNQRHI